MGREHSNCLCTGVRVSIMKGKLYPRVVQPKKFKVGQPKYVGFCFLFSNVLLWLGVGLRKWKLYSLTVDCETALAFRSTSMK